LTDFLFSTRSSVEFHRINLEQNPSHYPAYAHLIGANAVAWMQENLGAGVWYVTMVKVEGFVSGWVSAWLHLGARLLT
jgi:translocator assembly and maintenance protein 41